METEYYISKYQINKTIKFLGEVISKHFYNEELILICVLKGSFIFAADLMRSIKSVNTKIDFIQISSYGDSTESSGIIKLKKDLDYDIEGKNVLIVEDIIDTGLSMKYLTELLSKRNPKILKTCTLLNKKERRKIEFNPDYIGFDIEDKFVIGYGLDYNEEYRGIPEIKIIESE